MKKIFIHGGSSEITKYLVKDFYDTYDEFHIFVRNLEKAKNSLSFYEDKIIYYVNHLDDLNQSLLGVKKLPNDINSIIWLKSPDVQILSLILTEFSIISPNWCKKKRLLELTGPP